MDIRGAHGPGDADSGGSPDQVVRVLIVDDHEVLAASLAHVLDLEPDLQTVGVAGTLERAMVLVRSTRPDVVLLDHRMPDGDGIASIPDLRASQPDVRIVVLTASVGDQVLVAAIEAGVSGFVSKTRSLGEVTSAVRAAASGEAVISPAMLVRLLPRLHKRQRSEGAALTEREREVLSLLAEGMTNAAIAEQLVVSVHTVRNHIANLSSKLGAHSKLEALSIAVREGLLPGS